MDEQLKKLHERLIVMMQEIHKICMENDIKYTLIGGSLIGALRHKGFIPWDDDMDIGMTWDNYCKFIEVTKKMRHDWLDIDVPSVERESSRAFIKVYDTRTTFIENMDTTPNGVFIDIMPFSYCGNSKRRAFWEFYLHRFYIGLLFHKDNIIQGNGKVKEKIRCFAAKFFTYKFLLSAINRRYIKLNKKATLLMTDLDGLHRGITFSKYFEKYTIVPFENVDLMIITQADAYLNDNFGNYMQLPPKEERAPHHILYLNTELSYKDYIQKHKL